MYWEEFLTYQADSCWSMIQKSTEKIQGSQSMYLTQQYLKKNWLCVYFQQVVSQNIIYEERLQKYIPDVLKASLTTLIYDRFHFFRA